jgi:hypothetical protein
MVARIKDLDDRVSWLIGRSRFERALEIARLDPRHLRNFQVAALGERYLQALLDRSDYAKAAQELPIVAGKSKELWEKWILVFVKAGHTDDIYARVPREADMQLGAPVYGSILEYFAKSNPKQLLVAMKELPQSWYDAGTLVSVVKVLFEKTTEAQPEERKLLSEAMALLYISQKDFRGALRVYSQTRNPILFEFVTAHGLFQDVSNQVPLLMSFGEERAMLLSFQLRRWYPKSVTRDGCTGTWMPSLRRMQPCRRRFTDCKLNSMRSMIVANFSVFCSRVSIIHCRKRIRSARSAIFRRNECTFWGGWAI